MSETESLEISWWEWLFFVIASPIIIPTVLIVWVWTKLENIASKP